MPYRIERVNALLRQEISQVLAADLNDPRLATLVSIVRVSTSRDLRLAKVYVSVMGDEAAKQNTLLALKSAAGFIHRSMRKTLDLKNVPMLDFRIDDSIEQGAELLRLIKEVAPVTDGDGAS